MNENLYMCTYNLKNIREKGLPKSWHNEVNSKNGKYIKNIKYF